MQKKILMKNKKKILIVGSNEDFSLEKMYQRSLLSLGHNVKILNIYKMHRNLIIRFFWKFFKNIFFILFNRKLLNYSTKNKNFDLIIIFKGIYLNKNTLKKVKINWKNAKIINIYTDNPFNINKFTDISSKHVLENISFYDYFFIWSKSLKNKLEKVFNLNNVFILPFGNDEFIHKKFKNSKKKYEYDVSFVGTADKKRISVIRKLKDFKIIVAGMGWENVQLGENVIKNSAVSALTTSKIYSMSKISLNILREQNYDSHNMKTFEIPSMNGLLMTRKSNDQNYFFPKNKACLMYDNEKKINLMIKKVLSNYKYYYKIRNYGFKIAKKHTYKKRSKYLLKKIFG